MNFCDGDNVCVKGFSSKTRKFPLKTRIRGGLKVYSGSKRSFLKSDYTKSSPRILEGVLGLYVVKVKSTGTPSESRKNARRYTCARLPFGRTDF